VVPLNQRTCIKSYKLILDVDSGKDIETEECGGMAAQQEDGGPELAWRDDKEGEAAK
jgi:hypothetical protein